MHKNQKKLIILTQYYPPETGAPQNRLSNIARQFKESGFDVYVLTAKPNYPRGIIQEGYKQGLINRIQKDEIDIVHCWLFVTRSKNLILRLVNYFSFVLSSALIGTFLLPKADLLIMESPPLFLSISAWWLSRIKRAKLILNVSDLYPETAIALGMLNNKFLQKVFYSFEAWSYKISALVTGQTQGIINSIQQRFPDKATFLLTNGFDMDQFHLDSNLRENKHEFIIGYAGVLGYAQNLGILIKTAKSLEKFDNIKFRLYGDGPMSGFLQAQIQSQGLKNMEILGHFPHPEIIKIMHSWDIGLVPLANTPLMAGALPSKMFEIMGFGLPVVLISPKGEASDVIEKSKAGIWIDANHPEGFVEALVYLRNNPSVSQEMGENGRKFVMVHYDRKKIFTKFLQFLQNKCILSSKQNLN